MKYICLGYIEDKYFTNLTEKEQRDFMDSCFVYDEELQKKGHMVGGEALQHYTTATTVRFRNGQSLITDGSVRGNQRVSGRHHVFGSEGLK